MMPTEKATSSRREDVMRDFDRAAAVYDSHATLQRDICRVGAALAQSFFPPQGIVADLGCGTGFFAAEAKSLGVAWDIVQLDLSPAMCRRARDIAPLVACADAMALPLPSAGVQGVFTSLMLQWVSAPERAIGEIARVLQPGGRALLITFGPQTLQELRASFVAAGAAPRVHDFVTLPQWLAQAQQAGLHSLQATSEVRVEHYPDVQALIDNIRAIGAASKRPDRRQEPLSPAARQQMETCYRRDFGASNGIRASWDVLTLVLEKCA